MCCSVNSKHVILLYISLYGYIYIIYIYKYVYYCCQFSCLRAVDGITINTPHRHTDRVCGVRKPNAIVDFYKVCKINKTQTHTRIGHHTKHPFPAFYRLCVYKRTAAVSV